MLLFLNFSVEADGTNSVCDCVEKESDRLFCVCMNAAIVFPVINKDIITWPATERINTIVNRPTIVFVVG